MGSFGVDVFGLALLSLLQNIALIRIAPDLLGDGFSIVLLRNFLINFTLYSIHKLFVYPFFMSPLRRLPGPKDTSLIGEIRTEGVYREPGKIFLDWVKTIPNDGVIRFRGIFNRERLLLTSEEAHRAVLGENSYDYVKPAPVRNFLAQILGNGLILSEGEEHKFQRKHVLPAFQIKQLRNLYPIFWDKSRQLIEILESEMREVGPEGSIEFGAWATRATLDIIGLAGMGRDFHSLQNANDELVESYNDLLYPSKENGIFFAANVILGSTLTKMIPWHLNKQFAKTTGVLRRYCLDLVTDRKEELSECKAEDRKDIITELIRSNNFSDSELADQMLTFLAAGHETTSSAITWLCYLLAKNPSYQTRLRTEIREKLTSPSIDPSKPPSVTAIESLPLLHAIISETLRLYPTVPVTIREAIRPTTILLTPSKTTTTTTATAKATNTILSTTLPTTTTTTTTPTIIAIPAGTRILIAPWATNRSPHIWGPDSESFRPERWMSSEDGGDGMSGAQGKSNYSSITFLHGSRSCIGQGFARAEVKCLAACIVGRFEVVLADNREVWPAGVITIKPGLGLGVKLRRIEGW